MASWRRRDIFWFLNVETETVTLLQRLLVLRFSLITGILFCALTELINDAYC